MNKNNGAAGGQNHGQEKPGLRMNELVKAAGLPKSTILYYLERGLLPQPVKTSPNMAYYPPECVERINFIRRMQKQHRLPLSKIKLLLTHQDQDNGVAAPLEELLHVIFASSGDSSLDRGAFCQATGLAPEQVEDCLRHRILLPLEDGRFDAEDVAVGKVLAVGLGMGLNAEEMEFYPRLGEEIVDHEMESRRRVTEHLPMEQDAAVTVGMVQAARIMRSYIIDRIFQMRVVAMKGPKDHPGNKS